MVTVFLSANVMADGKSKTVSKGKGKGKVANGITPGAAINADKSNTAITSSNTSLKTKQSSVLIITNVVKVIFENDKSKVGWTSYLLPVTYHVFNPSPTPLSMLP